MKMPFCYSEKVAFVTVIVVLSVCGKVMCQGDAIPLPPQRVVVNGHTATSLETLQKQQHQQQLDDVNVISDSSDSSGGGVIEQSNPDEAPRFVNGPTGFSVEAEEVQGLEGRPEFVNGPSEISVEALEEQNRQSFLNAEGESKPEEVHNVVNGPSGISVEALEGKQQMPGDLPLAVSDPESPEAVAEEAPAEEDVLAAEGAEEQDQPEGIEEPATTTVAEFFDIPTQDAEEAPGNRGVFSTDPENNKKKILLAPGGEYKDINDWSKDSSHWNFKGGDWAKLNLPNADHPNLPAPEVSGPSLVVITDMPDKEVFLKRELIGLHNATLHYRYFLSEGVLPHGIPVLKVYQTTDDSHNTLLATETDRGAWIDRRLSLPESGNFKILFSGRLNKLGNEIALDDITLYGIVDGEAVTQEEGQVDKEEQPSNQETEDKMKEEEEEPVGSSDKATTTLSPEEEIREMTDANNESEVTEDTHDLANNEEVQVNSTESFNGEDGLTQGSDSQIEGNSNTTSVPADTSIDVAEGLETGTVNTSSVENVTVSSQEPVNDNASEVLANDTTGSNILVGGTEEGEDITVYSNTTENQENTMIINNNTTEELYTDNSDSTDNSTNYKFTDTSFTLTNNPVNLTTSNPETLDNLTGSPDNSTNILLNGSHTTLPLTAITSGVMSILNATETSVSQIVAHVTSPITSNTTVENTQGPLGNLTATDSGSVGATSSITSVNTGDIMTLTNSTSPSGVVGVSPTGGTTSGIAEGEETQSGSSWGIFKVFLTICVLGVAVLGFLYWRNRRKQDDEIPVFTRGSHTDYHNPTFTPDDDSSFASLGTRHNYKSFD